jgi:hypothetical protein
MPVYDFGTDFIKKPPAPKKQNESIFGGNNSFYNSSMGSRTLSDLQNEDWAKSLGADGLPGLGAGLGWNNMNHEVVTAHSLPALIESLRFQREMQPQQQAAQRAAIMAIQNPGDLAASFRAGQFGNAREAGYAMGSTLAAQNPAAAQSLMQGAQLHANNQAADASASFDADLQSPEGKRKQLESLAAIFSQINDPAAAKIYAMLRSLANDTEATRSGYDQAHRSSNIFGDILGQLVGFGVSRIKPVK